MNILLLFSSSDIGGAERSLTRMVYANNNSEVKYQISTFSKKGVWSKYAKELGLLPICFDNNFIKLLGYVVKNRPDVIYIIGFRLSVYLRLFRFLFFKTKLVQGIRWNPASATKRNKFFRFFESYFSTLIIAYITNSKIAKDALLNIGISQEKINVIYNGLDIFPKKSNKLHQNKVISIANLNKRKGYIEFLSVIEKVLIKVPSASFLFIGKDNMNGAVENKIIRKKLNDSVKCLGFQGNVSQYMQQSNIFVLPSLYGEGCPTSILEAFAHRMSVAAYKIDGIPELVDDQKDGLLFEPGDVNAMADGIIDLLLNPLKAKKMGNIGYKKVKSNFSINNMLEKHNSFFLSLE